LLTAETLRQKSLLDTAAGLRKEAARSRRLADEATDSRLKADLAVYAHELDARTVLMEQAIKVIGLGKPLPAGAAR
jgi:hypothetical protein